MKSMRFVSVSLAASLALVTAGCGGCLSDTKGLKGPKDQAHSNKEGITEVSPAGNAVTGTGASRQVAPHNGAAPAPAPAAELSTDASAEKPLPK